jgi:ABC-type transporter Mla MlaB component
LIYLSLVGSLDRSATNDLLLEFDERVRAATRRCILDLGGAESFDPAGLSLLDSLRLRTRDRGMQFNVTAGEGSASEEVRRRAGESWIDFLPELPLSA